ncbi:DNA repair protein RecO [Desulfurobacterium sp. TC5-1]|uniref:DNA repair protein RecO n=1 Tax=Desulfurobacterium sp. TC5-1 TaxID=1158318 RepID=UPI0003B672BF|nr:DNA repair protein RecO [Desulfurobacterium sp. TC5-1]
MPARQVAFQKNFPIIYTMMKTGGIVLRKEKLSDRLLHLSIYTEKMGKINALTKVELKNFPLSTESFSISQFTLKITGEKIEIIDAKLLKHNFPENLPRYKYLNAIAKYVINFTGGVPDKRIFNLISFYMNIKKNFLLALTMFLIKLTYFEGLFPVLDKCVICNSKNIKGFSIENGGVVCEKCIKNTSIPWNRKLTKEAQLLLKTSFYSVSSCKIGNIKRIKNTFEKHLSYRNGM